VSDPIVEIKQVGPQSNLKNPEYGRAHGGTAFPASRPIDRYAPGGGLCQKLNGLTTFQRAEFLVETVLHLPAKKKYRMQGPPGDSAILSPYDIQNLLTDILSLTDLAWISGVMLPDPANIQSRIKHLVLSRSSLAILEGPESR